MSSADRFVLAGLARARTEWFRGVAAWAMSGAIPAEFLGCISAEELRVSVSGGRLISAALLDGGLHSVDRDLVAHLREEGIAPLLVESPGVRRNWLELGAAAVLPATFSREQLLDALRATARPIETRAATDFRSLDASPLPEGPDSTPTSLAPVISVCGAGGTGASTVAIALAQGLAAERPAAPVLLADLSLRADQAALHDARDIVPGVQELVEAHRNGRPSSTDITALTFRVVERGYHLLLGMRRPSSWTSLRPRAFQEALRGLRSSFSAVVADIDADLEGESDSGSVDIEERNVMARTAVQHSVVVLAVGRGGLSGLAGLVRTVRELLEHGVAPERILPVCTPAPRSPARRAEFARAFGKLLGVRDAGLPLPGLVFLPRRRLDEALRDGEPIPKPLPRIITRAVRAIADPLGQPEPASSGALVQPGSLGLTGS